MKSVCRAILLHNEFVPAIEGERDWEYQVLGHYDGMTVKEAVTTRSAEFLKQMFQINAQYEGEKADYSTQCFWGFHSEPEKEGRFWSCKMPFVFISFIQFTERNVRKYREYLESETYIQEEISKLKSKGTVGEINTLAYYTMDTSDLMLVIKCSRCENGVAMINDLHHDIDRKHPFTLRSSYSVLAIDREYVEDSAKADALEENIGLLELRVVERESGSIDGLYQQLGDEIKAKAERKSLLGAEDETIIIRNLPWKIFLPLYRKNTGILCNSNKCTMDYVDSVSAKILYPIKENGIAGEKRKNPPKDLALLCDYLHMRVDDLYNGNLSDSNLSKRKTLVMLINAFRRMESSWHSGSAALDYNFYAIFFPFAVFIILHEKQPDNQREYYDFIERLRLCTQNYVKSNRAFLKTADFNVRYFDVPAKLLAIYNAYIYEIRKLLNTKQDRQYEFLICPGMSNKIEVKELYVRTMEDIHLFKVEIPEAQMYMVKPMFITLGHEVSHFVGTDLRKRDARLESVLTVSAHMVRISIQTYLRYTNFFEKKCIQNEDVWEKIEGKIYDDLKFYMERCHNNKYLKKVEFAPGVLTPQQMEKQRQFYDKYAQHMEILKRILYISIDDMLSNRSIDIFENIIWESFVAAVKNGSIKYEERDAYYEEHKRELLRCVEAFRGKRGIKTEHLTILNGIECIMNLMEECYADLICILSLQLSLKDYLYSFISTLDSAGYKTEKINDIMIIARIAVVFSVLNYDMKDKGKAENDFRWHDTKSIQSECDERIVNLYKKVEEFRIACFKEKCTPYDEEERIDVWILIRNRQILMEIIKYLLRCREGYSQLIACGKKEQVKEIYLLSQMSDTDDFFESAIDILSRYEKEIHNKIPAWIEREKHRGESK